MADQTIPDTTLARLEAVIAQRRGASPDSSYVAKLHARGLPEIAKKLGEEAVEAVIAALAGSREELVGEAADVLFHLLVLLGAKNVALADVLAELDRREGVSGIAEKASRPRIHIKKVTHIEGDASQFGKARIGKAVRVTGDGTFVMVPKRDAESDELVKRNVSRSEGGRGGKPPKAGKNS